MGKKRFLRLEAVTRQWTNLFQKPIILYMRSKVVACLVYKKYVVFQVHFEKTVYVNGIKSQGRDDYPQWVTSFKMLYSIDCVEFLYFKLPGGNHTVLFFFKYRFIATLCNVYLREVDRKMLVIYWPLFWPHVCFKLLKQTILRHYNYNMSVIFRT